MILSGAFYVTSDGELARLIMPDGDSLPVCTWRGEGDYTQRKLRGLHRYPVKGCQGEPLPERKCRASTQVAKELRCSGGQAGAFYALGACACEDTP